jgi:Na+-transporting NADH:ubiquinone oxidoreductase subunit NqrC
MSRSSWKETAELIGIVAIVVSLIALVIELRQTQSALLAQTYQTRAIDAVSELLEVADSEYLAPILTATNYASDFQAVADLSAEDWLRLSNFLRARMVDWDNEHYQYQNGYLDEDFFRSTTEKAVTIWAPRWRNVGLIESREEFRQYVDTLLAENLTLPD